MIVDAIKARGLDGMAATEHSDPKFGFKLKEAVDRYFPGQVLIIPGCETPVPHLGFAEVVELFLPGGEVFRFLAHPSYPYPDRFQDGKMPIHGIELHNHLHDRQLDRIKIADLAQRFHLPTFQNSDAHQLQDIGAFYNEVDLEELASLARRGPFE